MEREGQRPPLPEPGQKHGKAVEVSPPFLGGKNWNPMAYSQDTGLFYVPANHWKEDYWTEEVSYTKAAPTWAWASGSSACTTTTSAACAPWTRSAARWSGNTRNTCRSGPVLATAGNLVFTGTGDGYFKAFDAKSGKELWKFQTGSGIVSPPITWEQDGEQYLGVTVGYGGAVPLWAATWPT